MNISAINHSVSRARGPGMCGDLSDRGRRLIASVIDTRVTETRNPQPAIDEFE